MAHVCMSVYPSTQTPPLAGNMHAAAADTRQGALIIEYMGTNISTLRCMNLRDYLELKVEIQGTSGEGSSAVKDLKPAGKTEVATKSCMPPSLV